MHLTVVLVNWRNTGQTIQCARGIKRWRALKSTVLIVDNESTNSSWSSLTSAGVADKLIRTSINRGYGGGNNLGIQSMYREQNSVILLLNPDVEIAEPTVQQLLQRLNAFPEIAIVGPVLRDVGSGQMRLYAGGRDIAQHSSTRLEVGTERLAEMSGCPLLEVDYVPGTVFMARSTLYHDVGLLDERYFFSGEIADLCKRARSKGIKACIDLQAEAIHRADYASNELRESMYIYYSVRNRFLYIRKHYPCRKAEYFRHWTMLVCKEAVAAILRGQLRRARAVILALAHGYLGRYGNQNAKFN